MYENVSKLEIVSALDSTTSAQHQDEIFSLTSSQDNLTHVHLVFSQVQVNGKDVYSCTAAIKSLIPGQYID